MLLACVFVSPRLNLCACPISPGFLLRHALCVFSITTVGHSRHCVLVGGNFPLLLPSATCFLSFEVVRIEVEVCSTRSASHSYSIPLLILDSMSGTSKAFWLRNITLVRPGGQIIIGAVCASKPKKMICPVFRLQVKIVLLFQPNVYY